MYTPISQLETMYLIMSKLKKTVVREIHIAPNTCFIYFVFICFYFLFHVGFFYV